MPANLVRFAQPPQRVQFPAQPRPQGGIQIGGGDGNQEMMQLLALLQFMSSQESQERGDLLEEKRFASQEDLIAEQRQELLRTRTVGETTQVLGELDKKAAETFNRFLRSQEKLTKAGRDSLEHIDRRAVSLLGRLRGDSTSLNRQKVDDFLNTELPGKVAEIVSSTTDPARLEGLQIELNRILNTFGGATTTSSEAIRIHQEETFRGLNQAHGPERQAKRYERLQQGFQENFRQFKATRQQEIQERLRRHDTDPEGTPRSRIFEAIDQSRELPENLIPDIAETPQTAPAALSGLATTAPLVTPEPVLIGKTSGLIPTSGETSQGLADIRTGIGEFFFGDPGTAVGLPTAEEMLRAEQEVTGLSNEGNTRPDLSRAAPVRLIESTPPGALPGFSPELHAFDQQAIQGLNESLIGQPGAVAPEGPIDLETLLQALGAQGLR